MSPKTHSPVDGYIGSRVRLRRILIGMSQKNLGDELGITFQQVQKYEKGKNRVSCSRLHQISKILYVSPRFFFEGYKDTEPTGVRDEYVIFMDKLAQSRQVLRLVKAFENIENQSVKDAILKLVESASDGSPC